MITNASLPFVVLYMSFTAATIEPMSPLPEVPLKTPQSIKMYSFLPRPVGTVTKKKSPKPTRYIRTLRPFALLRETVCLVALAAFFDAFFVAFRAVGLRVDFFVRVVISQPRMQHVEVHLEATGIVPLE